jgi:superoxide reductase
MWNDVKNMEREKEKNLLVGVNEVADPANPSNLEKQHIPTIQAPESVKKGDCFEVTLEVGKAVAHPNEQTHFVRFMDLYADDTFLSRTDFTAGRMSPKVSLYITLRYPVRQLLAYAYCNLHGTWVGRKTICVET